MDVRSARSCSVNGVSRSQTSSPIARPAAGACISPCPPNPTQWKRPAASKAATRDAKRKALEADVDADTDTYDDGARRGRHKGITIGLGRPGPLNAITDVAGVRVGHATIIEGDGPSRGEHSNGRGRSTSAQSTSRA